MRKEIMNVSVIVPTFNRSGLLRETITSIIKQTFRDFEIIVIDNCSVDDTESVLKSFHDDRIKYFKHQNNGIIAVNMNYGMKKAKGDYIAFCDDDDLWMPEKLEKQISEFEKDEHIALVCSNGIHFNETGDGRVIYTNINDKHFTFESLLFDNRVINSSILVKKSVIGEVGMMDEEPEFLGGEEFSLWIRIVKKYKVKYLDEPLVKYRTHGNVYRTTNEDSLIMDEKIYEKLLNTNVIDITLFNKAKEKLNYKHVFFKIKNNENVDVDMIRRTKMGYKEKIRLIFFYLIYQIGILNLLQRVKHNF